MGLLSTQHHEEFGQSLIYNVNPTLQNWTIFHLCLWTSAVCWQALTINLKKEWMNSEKIITFTELRIVMEDNEAEIQKYLMTSQPIKITPILYGVNTWKNKRILCPLLTSLYHHQDSNYIILYYIVLHYILLYYRKTVLLANSGTMVTCWWSW